MKLPDLAAPPQDADGPVFGEPWEAQAFAMAVKLNEAGVFAWREWAEILGRELASHPERTYYENWLTALEAAVEAKGLIRRPEREARMQAWDAAARATPHGQPIVLSRSSRAPETPR